MALQTPKLAPVHISKEDNMASPSASAPATRRNSAESDSDPHEEAYSIQRARTANAGELDLGHWSTHQVRFLVSRDPLTSPKLT